MNKQDYLMVMFAIYAAQVVPKWISTASAVGFAVLALANWWTL